MFLNHYYPQFVFAFFVISKIIPLPIIFLFSRIIIILPLLCPAVPYYQDSLLTK